MATIWLAGLSEIVSLGTTETQFQRASLWFPQPRRVETALPEDGCAQVTFVTCFCGEDLAMTVRGYSPPNGDCHSPGSGANVTERE